MTLVTWGVSIGLVGLTIAFVVVLREATQIEKEKILLVARAIAAEQQLLAIERYIVRCIPDPDTDRCGDFQVLLLDDFFPQWRDRYPQHAATYRAPEFV